MKKTDMTKKVMNEVASFEERRSRSWFIAFCLTIFVLFGSIVGAIVRTYMILSYRRALDVLEIFGEDREIFLEYWQDALFIFFSELPRGMVLFALCFLILLVVYWMHAKHQMRITARRLSELAKLKKSRNNTNE